MIHVETTVNAPLEKVWKTWVTPGDIDKWAAASDDWEARDSRNDVRVGGDFHTTMAAKDGSEEFAFGGKYTIVEQNKQLEYVMDNGRKVVTMFTPVDDGVKVVQELDAEKDNPEAKQQQGWQAILDNFKRYVED